jgi:hypothetical protein
MKKKILGAIGALSLLAGLAVAQVTLPQVQSMNYNDLIGVITKGVPTAQGMYASALQLQACLFSGNSQRTGATAPALTSCGTSPAIAGNDYAGTVTMGTGSPTGCVITFNTAYSAAPHCVVSPRSQITSFAYTVSATAITITQTGTSSDLADYVCVTNLGSST